MVVCLVRIRITTIALSLTYNVPLCMEDHLVSYPQPVQVQAKATWPRQAPSRSILSLTELT